MNNLKPGLRSERGAELIEFALILPMLLLIMLGIVDFGFMFQRYEVLTNAAREGARIAVLPGYTTEDVEARVCAYVETGGLPLTGACPIPSNPVIDVDDVTIAMPAGTALEGKSVSVTFTHSYMFVGPIAGLFSGTFTTTFPITSTAVMRNELASAP
jgi:Flp pilus assembly protein TadG